MYGTACWGYKARICAILQLSNSWSTSKIWALIIRPNFVIRSVVCGRPSFLFLLKHTYNIFHIHSCWALYVLPWGNTKKRVINSSHTDFWIVKFVLDRRNAWYWSKIEFLILRFWNMEWLGFFSILWIIISYLNLLFYPSLLVLAVNFNQFDIREEVHTMLQGLSKCKILGFIWEMKFVATSVKSLPTPGTV